MKNFKNNFTIKEVHIQDGCISLTPILSENIGYITIALNDNIQWKAYRDMREQNEYDGRDYWVQMQNLVIMVVTTVGVFRIKIKAGWVTDLGSVPLRARSFVGHTDPKWLLWFLVHDALFSTNALSFEMSNQMLIEGGRFNKASWLQRTIVSFAVNTSKGKSAYAKSDEELEYERKWAEIRWDSK